MTMRKKIYAASIILVANTPCLKNSLKRNLETFFWKNITLDTINRYNSMYGYSFYRETKYLTKDFKEGEQYNPEFSSWDNTMDWRNHLEDRLGEVCFFAERIKQDFMFAESPSSLSFFIGLNLLMKILSMEKILII